MSRPLRKPRIVGIGGGPASAAAVAQLRSDGFDGDITLVSAEETVPYERPPLSKEYLMGRSGSVPATADQLRDDALPLKRLVTSAATAP